MNYSTLFPADTLDAAGLTVPDVEFSIGLAFSISQAVQLRRAAIREQTRVHGEPDAVRDQREAQEKADDDRVFLGTVVLLAQRMKVKVQSGKEHPAQMEPPRAAKTTMAG